jgi:hypothetical protein
MARLLIGAAFGLVVGVVAGAAVGLHAEDPKADVETAAAEAGVDVVDLQGAVNTVGVDPYTYLRSVGALPPLPVPREPAIPPPVVAYNARVECIISKESGGANVANSRGSGAVGVAQYMPSTFAAHAREMGHPDWSPWNPAQARAVAAHDLALGRRAQWTVGGC